ncbi:allophanate hydrolase [Raphidocelis subcapitata]|uniref:Allophanate hydrolase n=1 Tax=Raphidocelis subcapitata TaxID=307507 RepID=A0A2V0PJQ0_9CHLO|nr:allophanate hydrolase [Raphidocelis subcapitata]|eukprot:GBF99242.1 allophanate hydrolase [Raphidocelis subcapitata]
MARLGVSRAAAAAAAAAAAGGSTGYTRLQRGGKMPHAVDLSLSALRERYSFGGTAASGGLTPSALLRELHPRLAAAPAVFIHLEPLAALLERCAELEAQPPSQRGPLWGVPFAVKDNIDVAGLPSTAACPAFSYTPEKSAPTVEALLEAGGVMVGKTNLDQFASGLVGTRSPYGVAPNAFDDRFIPGGSSSGSAAAVGGGLVTFALGTDTAGSGRVPAGYNGCVGIKPTLGAVSTLGVVPACASLDCVTVFARSVEDATAVMRLMRAAGGGAEDVWRRAPAPTRPPPATTGAFRFCTPGPAFLEWDGAGGPEMAAASAEQFAAAAARLEAIGGVRVDVDFAPFAAIAAMLYQSSFVAERYSGLRAFLDAGGAQGAAAAEHGGGNGNGAAAPAAALAQQRSLFDDDRLLPVTRAIISGAGRFTAVDVFDDAARMAALVSAANASLARVDMLLVPTALEHYLVEEVEAEEGGSPPSWPKNAKNGRFTNFVNLMGGLAGVSVPSGVLRIDYGSGASALTPRARLLAASGGPLRVALPFGVTLLAPCWHDDWLWGVAARMVAEAKLGCGPQGHGVAAAVRARTAAPALAAAE